MMTHVAPKRKIDKINCGRIPRRYTALTRTGAPPLAAEIPPPRDLTTLREFPVPPSSAARALPSTDFGSGVEEGRGEGRRHETAAASPESLGRGRREGLFSFRHIDVGMPCGYPFLVYLVRLE